MSEKRHEFELKLQLDERALRRLAEVVLPALDGCSTIGTRRLVSTYFDTLEGKLEKAGASLRIRETPNGRVQTAKLGTKVVAGVSNPLESEAPTTLRQPHPGAITDPKLRRKLTRLVDFSTLKPVFRTEIDRRIFDIVSPGVEAELALDDGAVKAGRRTQRIAELELELKSGHIDAFRELVTTLFADSPVRFPGLSKAGMGYALQAGAQQRTPSPAKANAVAVGADADIAWGFGIVCQSAAAQILGNWNSIGDSTDPEVAHQLRIGMRRMRSALRAFRPVIDNPFLRQLHAELGEFGRMVGALRDCDVMASDIVAKATVHQSDGKSAKAFLDLLAARSNECRAAISAEKVKPRWNRMALDIALLPHGAGWIDGPNTAEAAFASAGELARFTLARSWKKATKLAKRLDELDIAERHQLRKNLKTLRYGFEFFSSTLPKKDQPRFLADLKALQESFGYLNDVALAARLPEMLGDPVKDNSPSQRLLGFILGWHSGLAEREWAMARGRWKQLAKRRRPWA